MGAMSSGIPSGLFRYSDHSRRLIISHSVVFSKSKNRRFVRGTIPVSLSTAGGRSGTEQSDLFQKFVCASRPSESAKSDPQSNRCSNAGSPPGGMQRAWWTRPTLRVITRGYLSRCDFERRKTVGTCRRVCFAPSTRSSMRFNDAHVINTSVRVYAL